MYHEIWKFYIRQKDWYTTIHHPFLVNEVNKTVFVEINVHVFTKCSYIFVLFHCALNITSSRVKKLPLGSRPEGVNYNPLSSYSLPLLPVTSFTSSPHVKPKPKQNSRFTCQLTDLTFHCCVTNKQPQVNLHFSKEAEVSLWHYSVRWFCYFVYLMGMSKD